MEEEEDGDELLLEEDGEESLMKSGEGGCTNGGDELFLLEAIRCLTESS